MIVKQGNKYAVKSETGKHLGAYDSKAEAELRLRQIEWFRDHPKK